MTKIIDLRHVTQRTPKPEGIRIGRPAGLRQTYNPTPCNPGRGAKKYGKKFSKVIGNPALKHAGVNIIWNEV